jgi:hypothetical protein
MNGLASLITDLRYGLRQFGRSPGFALVAAISLALGIGSNAAVFSLIDDVLLRSLPVKDPAELILFRNVEGQGGSMSSAGENNSSIDPATGRAASTSFSLLVFERFREHRSALSHLSRTPLSARAGSEGRDDVALDALRLVQSGAAS